MTADTTRISDRLQHASIVFYSELDRADGLVVPLGHIAEIQVGNMHGLGMIARTALNEFELTQVGEIGQSLVANQLSGRRTHQCSDVRDGGVPRLLPIQRLVRYR